MGKTKRKYRLKIPTTGFYIKEGTIVAVKSGVSDRNITTNQTGSGVEHWFGIAERNINVDNDELRNAYKANINGSYYYFNKEGILASNTSSQPSADVYIVVSGDISGEVSKGVVEEGYERDLSNAGDNATRFGEDTGGAPMTILRPKDQFALAAMQSLIQSMPNPIGMSYGTINMIAEISYSVAEAMFEKAIEVRNTIVNKVNGGVSGEVFVNAAHDLDEVSDVTRHNISVNLKKLVDKLDELLKPLHIDNWYDLKKNKDGHYVDEDNNEVTGPSQAAHVSRKLKVENYIEEDNAHATVIP